MNQSRWVLGSKRITVAIAGLLLLLGILAGLWRMRLADVEIRAHLLQQAIEIARALDPTLVAQLAFAPEDQGAVPFETIRRQLGDYARGARLRSVYTLAWRGEQIVFGPESLPVGDALASPPGTGYLQPSLATSFALREGVSVVEGPVTDEYGTFVTALAPVLEPRSGQVLMLVGVDLSDRDWRMRLGDLLLTPLVAVLALVMILIVGTGLIRRRQRQAPELRRWLPYLEPAMTVIFGMSLTLGMMLLVHEDEAAQRRMLTQRQVGMKAEMIREELQQVHERIVATARFFEASEYVSRAEFCHFAVPLVRLDGLCWLAWAPQVAAAKRAACLATARQEGLPDFAIWEPGPTGGRLPAAERDFSWPIMLGFPEAEEQAAFLGLDLAAAPDGVARLQHAAARHRFYLLPGSSAGLENQLPGDLTALHPVHFGLVHEELVAQGPLALTQGRGFVVGSIHLQRLLAAVLARHEPLPPGMTVQLLDLGESTGGSGQGAALVVAAPGWLPRDDQVANQPPLIHPVFAFDWSYAVVARVAPTPWVATILRDGWLPGLCGLLLTFALAAFVAVLCHHQEQLVNQVRLRTAELVEEHHQLLSANRMLYLIIDTIPVRLFWKDRHFAYLGCNRLFAMDVGRASPTEVVGKTDAALGRREQAERHQQDDAAVIASGNPKLSYEELQTVPDGRRLWLRTTKVPIYAEDGSIFGVLGVYDDITDRKQAEMALRDSEKRIRTLNDNLLAGMVYQVVRQPDGSRQFTYLSEAVRTFYGVSPQEAMADPELIYGRIHADDRARFQAAEAAANRSRTPLRIELQMMALDGSSRWSSFTSTPTLLGDGTTRWDGIEFDVTDRHQVAARLQDEHARMLALFEAINQIIYVADMATYRILYVNRAAREAFGGDLVGQLCHEALQGLPEPCSFCTNALIKAIAPAAHHWEYHNSKLGRIFRLTDRMIRWTDGREVRFEMASDITDLKLAERERLEMERQLLHAQKLESLGIMAGGIAHDFNNLLMVILGNLELAQEETPPGNALREHLDDAMLGARHAAELTRYMLDYSGRGRHEVREINLNALVRENVHLLQSAIVKNAVFQFHLAEALPMVLADPGQLQQVVMNLVINAAEALGDSSGFITFTTGVADCVALDFQSNRLAEMPPPGRFVWFEVADSGCGMDAETLDKFFDPFFTTKFTGRGLGMAAVSGIIRAHHGAILVNSVVGSGTNIRVLLPSATASAQVVEPAAALLASATAGTVFRGAVLLVDDEEMLRRICGEMLAKLGYRPFVAKSGEEAVRILRDHVEIIAAIVDLSMPTMDGIATFTALRQIRPTLRAILSSGFNEGDVARRPGTASFGGFIHKPFASNDLAEALVALLSQVGK